MQVMAILVIVLGITWIVMCFVGVAMMSRSADMVTEALLPSLLGFAGIGVGAWVLVRRRRRSRERP